MSFLSPLFIWTDAMLKNGKSALESMQTAAKGAKPARVGVVPTADAPPARRAPGGKRKARVKAKAKAKGRSKSRRR